MIMSSLTPRAVRCVMAAAYSQGYDPYNSFDVLFPALLRVCIRRLAL